MLGRALLFAGLLASGCRASDYSTALERLTLDRSATYQVRDLELNRGDVKIYLTEGILSFFSPLDGHVLGAIFLAEKVEGGDGEILVLPPVRSERASLAAFTGEPNLNEHLRACVFFFADDTARELRTQMERGWSRASPEFAEAIEQQFSPVIHAPGAGIELRLVQSLLDAHTAAAGFFYAALYGRTLPAFSVFYDPETLEPVTIGRGTRRADDVESFQLWSAFRPRLAAPFTPPANRFSNYRIDTSIRSDLTLEVAADFDYQASEYDGKVVRFELSDRLHVSEAAIDGQPVAIFERSALRSSEPRLGGAFLLVSNHPLAPATHHVSVHYSGSVIRQTASGNYFVDDRTSWYPYSPSLRATFDLTFHCPQKLVLVSTGGLVSDEVHGEVRTVHRRSSAPRPFAGFNLGTYAEQTNGGSAYQVAVYSDRGQTTPVNDILHPALRILDFYTRAWNIAPVHSLSISPIEGYFGQGFPGLVYLSNSAYIRPEDRPPALRTARFDTFLNRMLLPHEIAHQWWGNVITAATYRSGWLVEAMANYAALQYVEATEGTAAVQSTLAQFRADLLPVDEAGPLDWGARLLSSKNPASWQTIVYGKGAWVLHMLRARLGDARFDEFQRQLLQGFQQRPFMNDDVRELAASLAPPGPERQRDPTLQQFFDTWVYNTGVPRLELRREGHEWVLQVGDVDNAFSVDVAIRCNRGIYIVRAGNGDNYLPKPSSQSSACALPGADTFLYRK